MVIDVNKLKETGITVRIYERNGKGVTTPVTDVRDPFIEVFFENGTTLPQSAIEAIRDMIPDEYFDAVVGNLHDRIHAIQILEAINRTGRARK